ncbi:hypothetical protein Tco_1545413, partial [Tanacetum coccineum]
MSLKYVKLDAHKIYEGDDSKFLDLIVFNEVMCKHPKWKLNLDRDKTRLQEPNEESGGSTKISRVSEEGDSVVHSNQETPNSGGSSIQRPTGRDAAKKKGNGKASPNNEFVEELRAMRIIRESEIKVMNKRLEIDKKREEREIKREERELKREEWELKKEERKTKKMYLLHLNVLLAKDHLSPEEEDMKLLKTNMSIDSDSESISSDSDSSSISSNSIEYHEWESRVVQYNQHIDRILEDVINYPNLVIQDQRTRARRVYRDREPEQGEARLMADYFVDNPVYDEVIFRRRFRMHKHLFFRIVDVVTANDRYFQQRVDATGRLSLSPLQKCTTAMRVLAYWASFDAVDEYLRM